MKKIKNYSFLAVVVLAGLFLFAVASCDPDSSIYEKGIYFPDEDVDQKDPEGETDTKKDDPSQDDKHEKYEECIENYCENEPHSDGTCYINPAGGYFCGCNPGYYWDFKRKGCAERVVLSTGQLKCYDNLNEIECPLPGMPFYGQDASLNGSDMRLWGILGSDPEEIVEDDQTDLQWQRTISRRLMSKAEAEQYCDELIYGGESDWRLPSLVELRSLVNYGDYSPAINTYYFPGTPSNLFVSSSFEKDDNDLVWLVSFGSAVVGMNSIDDKYHVRCVRGAVWDPSGGYTPAVDLSASQNVTHNETGLIWRRDHFVANDWQVALDHCVGDGNRVLPTINDLLTLVDISASSPASGFPGGDQWLYPDIYISSTTHHKNTDYAWSVNFMSGGTVPVRKTGGDMVVTVIDVFPGNTECPDGGKRIEAGIDGEVDHSLTKYICHDGDSKINVGISDEPQGENCPFGGKKLIAGIILDETDPDNFEVDEDLTTYFCHYYFFARCVSYPDDMTRVFTCSSKPDGSEWNMGTNSGSYTQAWDSGNSEWVPAGSVTQHSETEDPESCVFKCIEDYYTWNETLGVCSAASRTYFCDALPAGGEWNTVSQYEQNWDGANWVPPDSNPPTYNTLGSTTSCRYKCAPNYTWNGTDCVADTRNYSCPPKPTPAHSTDWNMGANDGSYTQVWDGSGWDPPNTITEYNETEAENSCRYICANGYDRIGTSCIAQTRTWNCETDGGGKPAYSNWNIAENYTQTWDGSVPGWVPADSTAEHNETSSDSSCRFVCHTNHVYSSGECEPAQRTYECPDKPEPGTQWVGGVHSYTQTWDPAQGEWLPEESATDHKSREKRCETSGNVCTDNSDCSGGESCVVDILCLYECAAHYAWSGTECLLETRVFNCDSAALPDYAEWNTVDFYEQTWDIGAGDWSPPDSSPSHDPTGSTTECRFKCIDNTTWEDGECKPNTRTFDCTNGFTLPANSDWNMGANDGSYTQTWNPEWDSGDEEWTGQWLPEDSSPVYNPASSETECRFKCSDGFAWNSDTDTCE